METGFLDCLYEVILSWDYFINIVFEKLACQFFGE